MSFVLQVNIRIKPENVDEFMKKLLENARAARNEAGCRQFDVLVDPQDRTKVMLYEVYADEKSFEVHQQGAAFKKYLDEVVPLRLARTRVLEADLASPIKAAPRRARRQPRGPRAG